MRSTKNLYLPRLDHLRFLAAVLVVVFHYFHRYVGDLRATNPLMELLDEGHLGIGLFMVTSGFVLTFIAGDKQIDYRAFLRNRLLRIYPLFVFAVFLTLFISTYNDHRNYGAAELLSWLVPFRSQTVPLSPYFVQLWTIWVEFQFYLLFPLLLLFSRRYGIRYLFGLLGLFLCIRLLVFLAAGSVRFLAYETIFGRMDQFLLGIIAARFYLKSPRADRNPLWLLAPLALLVILVRWFDHQGGGGNIDASYWIYWPTLEGLAWSLLILGYLTSRIPIPERVSRVLAAGGQISFSIYVMHNLVLYALAPHLGVLALTGDPIRDAALSAFLVAIPPVLVVSTLTYVLIEKPFLSLRRDYAQRSFPTAGRS